MTSFRRRFGEALAALTLAALAAGPALAAPAAPQFQAQAGAFRVERNARERCDRLAAAGLPMALTTEQRRGSPMFFCRSTGRFSRPEAEALVARIRATGTGDVGLVVAPPVGPHPAPSKQAAAKPAARAAAARKEAPAPASSPKIAPALRAEFAQFLAGHEDLLKHLPEAEPPPDQK